MELAPSTLLGLFLTISGILLYLIRIKQKKISRDYDLFFSSVGCLCGGILIFQGWRLDPILLLCQMMSGGTAIFFITETIWLRNIDIQKEEISLEIYENIFKTKDNSLLKKNLKTSNNINIQKSFNKRNYEYLIKTHTSLEDTDYTFPIDYYKS